MSLTAQEKDELIAMVGIDSLMDRAPDLTAHFFTQWCRLKGYKPAPDKLNAMIDDATDIWRDRILEFAYDCVDLIWSRIV